MDRQQLYYLLVKSRNAQLSDEEKRILMDFIQTAEGAKLLSEVWDDSFVALPVDEEKVNAEPMFRRILKDERLKPAFDEDRGRQSSGGMLRSAKQFRVAMVACISMVILVGTGVFLLKWQSEDKILTDNDLIKPGSNKARIVFDDGSFVELATIEKDTVFQDQGLRIYRQEDGSIAYEFRNEKELHSLYNTIITPKGGEYSLALPDGTKVWVNADSKLRYPIAFDKDVREVELEGEAYFEVEKVYKNGKKLPFIVKTGQQRLKVLGTSFNINSYQNDITTTLVEGLVALEYNGLEGRQYLRPSQQSNFSKSTKELSVRTVEPFYSVAWKEGKFAFEGASIYKVMDDISRWYDIDVQYEGDFSTVKYTGTISRFENFKQLLQLIEWTNLVTFKVDGRRVIVMK
ncbi:DUF4974 domain-containing protein [Sphingobacterium sp. SGG-5]|uniref:FecR family protein n=1 Tax=Sphingobacterium sp. SGG-5 TaxID=2710881 RepID=UPI0013ECF4E1|nr:FecR family protein [Sphingobacterium sp. SGG-5]NGM60300.1 DUF4974 domain-containing protein [Sphingobacterium sp. SGG-5]